MGTIKKNASGKTQHRREEGATAVKKLRSKTLNPLPCGGDRGDFARGEDSDQKRGGKKLVISNG